MENNNLTQEEKIVLSFLKKKKFAVTIKEITYGIDYGYRKLGTILNELISLKLVGKRIPRYNKKVKALYYSKLKWK